MLDEISKNKFKAKDYGNAAMMTANEKKISFLNRYFVYKKVRVVNTDAIELELSEYNDAESLKEKSGEKSGEKSTSKKEPKIRKLQKKLLLIPATDAIDEEPIVIASKPKTKKPKKKITIIDEDED
jgi:hypothetical protein